MTTNGSTEGGGAFLTTSQVAERLHVKLATVQRWARKKEIPSYKLPGGDFRYDPDEFELWLEAHHGSERDA